MSTSTQKTAVLLYCYGVLMILCSVSYIFFVSWSLHITVLTSLIAGLGAIAIGYYMWQKMTWAFWLGLALGVLLLLGYGWLTMLEVHSLVDDLQNGDLNLKPYKALYQKANGFIIHLTLLFSTVVALMLQVMQTVSNEQEL